MIKKIKNKHKFTKTILCFYKNYLNKLVNQWLRSLIRYSSLQYLDTAIPQKYMTKSVFRKIVFIIK